MLSCVYMQVPGMNKKAVKIIAILFLIATLGFVYHFKYINEFPSYMHAWAQSDRYALSLGFTENGLNFFKPQTFVYNHQFPDNWQIPSEKTITAVDFPIHDFIPAIFMKISGNSSPWIFRMYILLYSFWGLFFLFRLSFAVTKNFLKSVFVTVFAATSPVFVYYQGGFLPTIPSLSNAIIGIYFYYQYLAENRERRLLLSILFLTLAALARTTFAIPLVAVAAIEFIRLIKKETALLPKIIPFSLSALFLLFYLFYNGYLRKSYGSIFLNHILPPENLNQAKDIIKYVYENLTFQYFTRFHYYTSIAILLTGFIFLGLRKTRIEKTNGYFGLLTATYLFGCVAFALLMLRQFPAHDYYFLDTFFFPVLMTLIFILTLIPITVNRDIKNTAIAVTGFVSLVLIIQPAKSQKQRREQLTGGRMLTTIDNYKSSSKLLDSLGIPKSSKVLVMDSDAPNIPFILMQRKGFAVMSTTPENIKKALTWDVDYVIVQNELFAADLYTSYPPILSKLDKIADNGKISVCRLTENNPQSLFDFMRLDKKKPVYKKIVTFENLPDSLWQNFNPTEDRAYSGKFSGHLTPDVIFGLTYKENNLSVLRNDSHSLFFSSYFITDTIVNCEIVVAISSGEEIIYYKALNLKNLVSKRGVWEQVSLLIQLPQIQNNDFEFALYIWNTGQSELYYDDFIFAIYE